MWLFCLCFVVFGSCCGWIIFVSLVVSYGGIVFVWFFCGVDFVLVVFGGCGCCVGGFFVGNGFLG